MKRTILEMPKPGNLIDLRKAENGLAVNNKHTTCYLAKAADPLANAFFTEAFTRADILYFYSSKLILSDMNTESTAIIMIAPPSHSSLE